MELNLFQQFRTSCNPGLRICIPTLNNTEVMINSGSLPKFVGTVLFCVHPFFDADDYDSYD